MASNSISTSETQPSPLQAVLEAVDAVPPPPQAVLEVVDAVPPPPETVLGAVNYVPAVPPPLQAVPETVPVVDAVPAVPPPLHAVLEAVPETVVDDVPAADTVPGIGVAVNYYDQNLVLWNRNNKYCRSRLSCGDPFSLPRMLSEKSWANLLKAEFAKEYAMQLCKFVENELKQQVLCPRKHLIFRSFNATPFPSVKVVILGQKEPYPYLGRAMGLAYSVPKGRNHPLELERILQEVGDDIGGGYVLKGNLENWALQGVLLLSFALTVVAKRPNSHRDHGWERFVDHVIETISSDKTNVVFMLWGETAESKINLIDRSKHKVLVAPSPSKMAFLGCKHFTQANNYLLEKGMYPINWKM